MNYRYTVIRKLLSGAVNGTHHYEHKQDAMQEVSSLIAAGYQVEVMKYSIWFNEVRK